MNKSKIINGFIIGTFVSLYILVSVVSTIHVIDFFELSNPYWLAVTLAIGFELGAAASLAALITLDKMNKSLVWALFITITAMQMQGNMYYAFISLEEYTGWVELFNLVEWEPLAQKRLLAAVSGAILPLVALGFIKSLVDYIKPESEVGELSTTNLEEATEDINDSEKKTDIASDHAFVEAIIESDNYQEPSDALKKAAGEMAKELKDWDSTIGDGLDELENEFRPTKHEPVKKVGLTQQVKEARVVSPVKRTRTTQPDNGLTGLVQKISKTQPGEN
jgi:hypothetical protein